MCIYGVLLNLPGVAVALVRALVQLVPMRGRTPVRRLGRPHRISHVPQPYTSLTGTHRRKKNPLRDGW